MRSSPCALAVMAAVTAFCSGHVAHSAEIVRLSEQNWHLVPHGKEVDAIYGDYLVRNDQVVAVIGDVAPGRNAHMSSHRVQGAVLDFTLLATNNDQLTAFKPHGETSTPAATQVEVVTANGPEVRIRFTRPPLDNDPLQMVTEYTLRDGQPYLRAVTTYRNTGQASVRRRIADKMRCDQTFLQTPEGTFGSVSFYDPWFRAAYAVVREGGQIHSNGRFGGMFGANSGTWLDYPSAANDNAGRSDAPVEITPGGERSITRYLIAARHGAQAQQMAASLLQEKTSRVAVTVRTAKGEPVPEADVVVRSVSAAPLAANTSPVAFDSAYSDAQGKAILALRQGTYRLIIAQIGRATRDVLLEVGPNSMGEQNVTVEVGPRSQVAFDVVDNDGKSSPCKVQFIGVGGTPEPDLGPQQRADGCRNLYFSPNGRFNVPLPSGRYYVIISRGPEYNAVYRTLNVSEGQSPKVAARLAKVVDSRGWVSTDFHNHSSESGDNTTEPESRITCLVAEGVDFAPSTEHNRIQTYRHRMKALGVEHLLGTSDGIELTGSPLPLNHQNAFPLVHKPRTQDGGGPLTDADPLAQIKRLYGHDDHREKLVQQNHPDIGWLVFDKDGDGKPDEGFGTLNFTHAIEIWTTNILAMQPTTGTGAQLRNNRIFNWLQLLNLGHRLPGVANTDAHHCFHDSGVIRNYVPSATDAPAKISEIEMVRNSKRGRLIMTNGPFMEVSLDKALPGDEVRLRGKGRLKVRVQCANWLDVDRVQVLVNGRPEPSLNFTRASHPQFFSDSVVKFDGEIDVALQADAHVIVVAIGEQSSIGPVMGQRNEPPIAISNPIYVDVDGGGFKANGDTLGAPLPTKKG